MYRVSPNLAPPSFLKNNIGKNLGIFQKNLVNITLTLSENHFFEIFEAVIKLSK